MALIMSIEDRLQWLKARRNDMKRSVEQLDFAIKALEDNPALWAVIDKCWIEQ